MSRDPEAKFRITATDETAASWNSAFKHANESSKLMGEIVEKAFVGVSLAAIGEVTLKAIEFGDEIGKAMQKAGIGAKAMSELAYAAKQSDVDLSSLSTALKLMQVNVAQGDATLKKLVGNFDDFKKLAPDKQFEVLAGAIADIADPALRANAAVQVFGRSGADLLPLFSQGAEGIRKAREEAVKFHQSFGEDEIKRLQDADESIKQLKASLFGMATTITAFAAPALKGLFDSFRTLFGGATDSERIQAQIEWLQVYASVLGSLPFEAARKQVAEWRTEIGRLQAQQEAMKPGDFHVFDEKTKAEFQANIEYFRKLTEARDLFMRNVNPQTRDEMSKNFVYLEQVSHEATESVKQDAQDRADLQKFLDKGIADSFKETNDQMVASLDESSKAFFDKQKSMSVYADEAARNMQDAFANFLFDPFKDGLKGMLQGFVDIVRRMIAEAAAAQIFKKLFGEKGDSSGGSALGGILGGLFSSFGGGMASGGPLESGKWYTAGEHGPEPIWGGGSGAFATGYGKMAAAGGGDIHINVVNNMDNRGATTDFQAAMPAILKQNNEQLKADIIDGIRRKKYPV